jgi:CRP-like cAMP-binding protein
VVLVGQLAIGNQRSSSIGEDETIVRLGPGDTFGELALQEHSHRTATVRVQQPSRLLRLSSLDFQRLVVEVVRA